MEKDYRYAVLIGRFQPFHNSHLELVRKGLEIADEVIIVVGSANCAPTIKNPFSFEQRRQFIQDSLGKDERKVHVVGVRDYFYNDYLWVSDIQAKVSAITETDDQVALIGNYKDSSSYYIKYFPQWDFVPIKIENQMSATDVRKELFNLTYSSQWSDNGRIVVAASPEAGGKFFRKCPKEVQTFLRTFKTTEDFADLVDEFHYLQEYKKPYEKLPYPPTFVTADAVVTCAGHVLVIKRGFNPGKGLYALPGGFVKQNEKLQDAALRELKEETKIRVDKIILESQIVDAQVFDHPDRSARGRTITKAFHVKLKDGKLPEIKGGSDATIAMWMPLMDVAKKEHRFFEDHAHIIMAFINKN